MTMRSLTLVTISASVGLLALAFGPTEAPRRAPGTVARVPAPAPPVPIVATVAAPALSAKPVFGYRLTPDGGRQIYFAAAELQFQKTAYTGGRTTVIFAADDDRVEISLSRESGFLVERNGARAAFHHADVTEADLDRTRALLAGSKAVRRLRTLAAAIPDSKHPGVIGLQLSDAIVGMLDGDVGAPARLGRRFRALRPAGLQQVKDGESCWYTYEQNVTDAEADRDSCLNAFAWWNPLRLACMAEWTIRVEGDWAEYLSCSSIGAILRE